MSRERVRQLEAEALSRLASQLDDGLQADDGDLVNAV